MTTETTPEPLEGRAEPAAARSPVLDGDPREHAAPVRRTGGLLHHHDFRLLWLGETISKTGSAITTVALPLVAVVTLAASPFSIGLLESAA